MTRPRARGPTPSRSGFAEEGGSQVPLVLGAVQLTELGALKLRDPAAWKARVLEALRAHGDNRTHAAAALGVSHRQFARWVRERRSTS